MACSSNQSVSSSRMTWKYDVFVSFRGEDTRNNFTDHLFGAFHRKGIVAFKDDTKLKKGENISPELLKAIEGSPILIVIFSRNYASSTWCLEELAKIVDCFELQGQTVLPIFYDVSPSEVRKQSGDFEKAFMEHEDRFKEKLEEVQSWRRALTKVANLSGWDVKDKPENAEIGKIIKRVTSLLGHRFSTIHDDIVGMHSPLEELEKLMMLNSDDDVRVVGICGMGGIGKTTLATSLYSRISNQFEACCYIDDVSKTYGSYGPIGVQKQLLCQTLNDENLHICNLYMASDLIRNRLCQMKSLVILDNVDQVEQLNKLAMQRERLGKGSRIIIISRNSHILRAHGVDEVYKVRLLDHNDALQLFSLKAFKSDAIMSGYIDLIYDVLKYANGLPLAIQALGTFLYGRDAAEWRCALTRLRENPRPDIMDVLRISFDGLEDTEKDIFLDIACFFHGDDVTCVKEILDFRGFHPEIGLKVLIDKSFIICEHGIICMHGLFKELGKSIVREKSPKEPRKWNRIWDYNDFYNVISENKASENVEAIIVRPFPENDEEMTTLRADALAQMSRLKLLILQGLNFSGRLNFLSNELGYLCWDKYPFTSLPSSFEPDKLVELILPYSNIRKLWEGTKILPNLIHIDLSHSKNLIKMPSFLEIPNLEQLNLEGCIKLVHIDPSIFCLSSLNYLNLSGCRKLHKNQLFKRQRQTKNLEMLDTKESTIQFQSTSFTVLKSSFRFLKIFRKREDSVCLLLPSSTRVSCLQYLDLSFCNLVRIPDAIGWLHCLEKLNLGGNNFVTLPSSIKELFKLRELNLEHCKQLKYFPELPSKTTFLVEETFFVWGLLNIFDCPSLIETECFYRKAFSWMIQLLKLCINSDLQRAQIDIVIPKTQIPMWFNKQNVGSSTSMNPLPNMDDKNLIGVACCTTFVVHDDPTSLGTGQEPDIRLGFQIKPCQISHGIPLHLEKDLLTIGLDHLLLVFYGKADFILLTKGLHVNNGIEMVTLVEQPPGLHLEIKSCGYHWIFKEDLEQLALE